MSESPAKVSRILKVPPTAAPKGFPGSRTVARTAVPTAARTVARKARRTAALMV